MRTRIAKKIFRGLYAYKGFETERQPYTKAQQRKAIRTLKIPAFIRPTLRLCDPVRKPYANASAYFNHVLNNPSKGK